MTLNTNDIYIIIIRDRIHIMLNQQRHLANINKQQ